MRYAEFKDSPMAEDLREPSFAADYLQSALMGEPIEFIIALRNIAEANGGIGNLSQKSELGRESLYKTLAKNGDSKPYFTTVVQILEAFGLQFMVKPISKGKKAA
jgi:probable addiction module antidote protein